MGRGTVAEGSGRTMRPHLPEEGREPQAQRQERLLAQAVGILMGDEDATTAELQQRFGPAEVRRVEEAIQDIAEQYRSEDQAARESGRINDAATALTRIEAACAELAAAFDEAGQDAYNVLNGLGPGGTQFTNMMWSSTHGQKHIAQGLDFDTVTGVAGRYQMPLSGAHSSGEALAEIHRVAADRKAELARLTAQWWRQRTIDPGPEAEELSSSRARLRARIDKLQALASPSQGTGDPVFWPEAVAALGAMIGAVRQDYEERFRPEAARLRNVRDQGPGGTLHPSAHTPSKARGKSSAAKPSREPARDTGGKQNLSHIMRGAPKWILTRECWGILEMFDAYWHPDDVDGSRSGRFFRFVLAVYAYAADEEVEEETGKGDKDYTAGLGHHIRAAVSIGPRLRRRKMFSDRLTERQREEVGSLQQAWADGRVPDWIEGDEAFIPQQVFRGAHGPD